MKHPLIFNSGLRTVMRGDATVYLSEQRFVIFCLLARKFSKPVTTAKIAHHLYSHRLDCDRPQSVSSIAIQICHLRQMLAPLHIKISDHRGHRDVGYQLIFEPFPEPAADKPITKPARKRPLRYPSYIIGQQP